MSNFLSSVSKKKKQLLSYFMTLCVVVISALNDYAEGTTEVSSQLMSSFTSGVNDIKTLLLGIVGVVMSIIVLKVCFRSGVKFFKSSASQ